MAGGRRSKAITAYRTGRSGLTILKPAKSFSLSVTMTQSFASATAAIIMSSGLRGRPFAVPSDISRGQMSAAFSSNDRMRPAKSASGPSGPENHRSSSRRFAPAGFSISPRWISATVREEIKRSASFCSAIHAVRGADGAGFVMLLMMLVSSRYRFGGRIKDQSAGPQFSAAGGPDRHLPVANVVVRQGFRPFSTDPRTQPDV